MVPDSPLHLSQRTPSGFLRYELPAGKQRSVGPLLALGMVLLATDQQTFKAFDAAGVAYSRVTSGQHFPSDVFFGAGIGILSAEGALRHRNQILTWRF